MSLAAVKEYLLDLQGAVNYKYTGSGAVNITGTAGIIIVDAYGKMDVWFQDREWVYDLNHNQWQVVAVTGSPNTLIWEVHGNGEIRFYPTEELLKFEKGPSFFTRKYQIIIKYYENLLSQVNTIIANYAAPVYVPFAVRSKLHYSRKQSDERIAGLMAGLNTIEKNVRNLNKNGRLHRTR
jgi:hypothetical protein